MTDSTYFAILFAIDGTAVRCMPASAKIMVTKATTTQRCGGQDPGNSKRCSTSYLG
jgi:hypothetical protein